MKTRQVSTVIRQVSLATRQVSILRDSLSDHIKGVLRSGELDPDRIVGIIIRMAARAEALALVMIIFISFFFPVRVETLT